MPERKIEEPAVLAHLRASAPRRLVGTGVLAALGLFFLVVATQALSGTPVVMAVLLVLGALILWLAVRLWQGTAAGLVLTRTDLRDTDGRLLTPVDQIRTIERGVFAFKPAGGFTIITAEPTGPAVWSPGLWWRAGRRIGVGGVTHRHEGRYMAEVLTELIASRR